MITHSISPLVCVQIAACVFTCIIFIFTALHGMQTRSSDENSVRLSVRKSVRPSVKRVLCDKTVEISVQIYTPYERSFSLVF